VGASAPRLVFRGAYHALAAQEPHGRGRFFLAQFDA
jgi:hypothetical protein